MTAMKKVMTRVCGVLNSIAGDMLHVSQKQIDETLSNDIGDVRSATLNLIFLSLKGTFLVHFILIKPDKPELVHVVFLRLLVPEQRSKNECGMREETLSLLHGVGRVLYPKSNLTLFNFWIELIFFLVLRKSVATSCNSRRSKQ